MTTWSRWLVIFLIAVGCAVSAKAETVTGKVVRVIDGDTVVILVAGHDQQKIRLAGIDAPEKNQPFGNRSKQSLSEKIFSQEVYVVIETIDRYQRRVGAIYLGDRWINREMVAEGWAWWYRRYSSSRELSAAEEHARFAKMGLWQYSAPEPPWEFRYREKRVAQSKHTDLQEKE
jgi:endonuclease YncB( thermonuclease family)